MRLYLDSCVLINALDGAEGLRRHTLQQLEGYAAADWVISDLVRMECLVGTLRMADQIRLLAFRSFFSDSRQPMRSIWLPRCTGAAMHCSPMTAPSSCPRPRSRCCDSYRISPAALRPDIWAHGNRECERSPDRAPAAPQP